MRRNNMNNSRETRAVCANPNSRSNTNKKLETAGTAAGKSKEKRVHAVVSN
jgi:hypothetical protein